MRILKLIHLLYTEQLRFSQNCSVWKRYQGLHLLPYPQVQKEQTQIEKISNSPDSFCKSSGIPHLPEIHYAPPHSSEGQFVPLL